MPAIKSEYACPVCKRTTGQSSQIVANGGELICSINSTHKWNDTMAFFNERPTMEFKVEIPRNLPQENYTPMTVSIPIAVKQKLETQFPDDLQRRNTVSGVLQMLAEGEVMMVPETDLDRIGTKMKELGLGGRPKSSSELFGMIYTLSLQVEEQKQIADNAVRDLTAYQGISPGRVVVNLGEVYAQAAETARAQGLPLPVYCEQNLKNGIANNWF